MTIETFNNDTYNSMTELEKSIYHEKCMKLNNLIQEVICEQGCITFMQLIDIMLVGEVRKSSRNAVKRELEEAIKKVDKYFDNL